MGLRVGSKRRVKANFQDIMRALKECELDLREADYGEMKYTCSMSEISMNRIFGEDSTFEKDVDDILDELETDDQYPDFQDSFNEKKNNLSYTERNIIRKYLSQELMKSVVENTLACSLIANICPNRENGSEYAALLRGVGFKKVAEYTGDSLVHVYVLTN